MIRSCSELSGKRVTVNRIHREREEKKDEEVERGRGRRRRCVGTIDEFLCPGYRSFSIIHLRSGLL